MSIDAMEKAHDLSLDDRHFEARQVLVDAIAEAKKLEQAQQAEPLSLGDKLYTSPSPRQPLTDEKKDKLANAWFSKDGDTDVLHQKAIALIEEVEAAHGIKE